MRPFLRSLTACAAGCSLVLLAGAAGTPGSDPAQRYRALGEPAHKVLVTEGAAAAQLAGGGARLIADYGAFQYFEANATALQDLGSRGVEDRTEENRILLNAGVVDTTAAATRSARQRTASFAGKRMHLVQFAGPVKPEWFQQLAKTRVQVIDYIPNNAYLVYGDASAIASVQNLAQTQPAIQFEGAFLDADRIHPRAKAQADKRNAIADAGSYYQIQLVADAAANEATLGVIDALKIEPIRRRDAVQQYIDIVVKLPIGAIDGLSSQPDVISIAPYVLPHKLDERQDIIVAGQLSGNQPSGPGYLNWLATKGFSQAQFDASAFVVDVTDSGVDNGTQTPNHFALYKSGNTANTSRVVYNRLEGTANSGSTIQGCDGHGNLNSHIIGGYVALTNFPHTDSAGYRYGLGVCPFVKVGSSVIFDPANFTDPDYEDLMSRAYRDGARISSDSWGADTAGGYDTDAQRYDYLVRDAQPAGSAVASNGNQQITICFAAGNAGSGAQTVGSPGTAKNVITVGAAENVHSHATTNGGNSATGSDGCSTPDSEANSANDMATFSSRGPCSDGRKKPEIVAPGTHITGGVGQNVRTMSGNGTALTCFSGEGVCALAGGGTVGSTNNFFPLGQRFYSTSSGTSHSTPALAGGAALTYQWYINQYGVAPSPAMVKAWLVSAARYMNGTGANDTLFSNNQGMGMMNLDAAFDGVARLVRDQLTNDLFTASGQQRTFTGRTVTSAKPIRVTLTWTDAPGSTSGNAYKNDLNLTVVVNGQTYRGNVFSGASSITGGSADTKNNTESVFLPAGTTGSVVVTVSAANINSDGVPNFGGALDQDFALVAYNFEEVQQPSIASAGSQLVAESCGIGNGAVDPDEVVTVRFALRNIGSADTTNVMATLQATGGVTSPSGAQSYGALLAGGAAVSNNFTFTATGACGGTVTATVALQDGATSLGSLVYTFPIGGTTAATVTNANISSISIPDSGAATPYPSTISVSGLAGAITKVTATLTGFAHTYPSDVDVILVSPDGQKVALMGGQGGGTSVSGLTLTFDDAASGAMGASLTSGTFLPSGSVASMPSPAPVAPYESAMSAFNGGSPNGTWSLYVTDAAAGDSGSIAQGWRLAIAAGEPLCCASNQPPILAPIGNKTVVQSNTLSFAVSATDPYDGDPITLSVSNAPLGSAFTSTNGNGNFTWTNALPVGVYTSTFYAVDKDGADFETIRITVSDGSCVGSNILSEGFDAATTVPAGWASTGTVNDTGATHYQSAPNCRALGANTSLTTPAVDYPTQIVFYVDASGPGDGQTATITYSVGGGAFSSLGSFVVHTAGSNVTFVLDSTPNLSGSQAVRFRFNSTFSTWYLDNVRISGGCPPGPAPHTPPVLSPIGNKAGLVSNMLQFAVTATPTDGDAVTLTASNLPGNAVFNATAENGAFIWTNPAPAGVYTTSFYAADADGVASETVTITISAQELSSSNVVVAYVFEDASSNFTRDANFVLAGVSAGTFGSGSGAITSSSGNPVYAVIDNGFTGTGDNYYQFALDIGSGSTISVSRIKFDDRKSNTGPSTWAVRSSVDGFATDLASGGTHTSFTSNEATLAMGDLSGSVTFRIYAQNGTGGGTWRLDNVTLVGGASFVGSGLLPSIAVTTAAQTVSNPTTSVPVGGTANTNVVGQIVWTNALTGATGTIPAATNWVIASVALNVGANTITVLGTNDAGDTATAAVTITRQSAGGGGGGCSNILFQGFEPGDGWTIVTGATYVAGNGGGTDTPANQRIRSGTNSWQAVGSGNRTLVLANASIAGYTNRQLSLRVSATSLTTGNGVENGDYVRIYVALDGAAFTANPDIYLNGGIATTNNARWGYWATNQIVTTAGVPVSNAAPQSATSTNNYANLFVNIPSTATSIALRVITLADANEVWNLDDIAVYGCSVGAPDLTPSMVITTANQTVNFEVTEVALGGSSSNLEGSIRWTNNLTGDFGAIAAASAWLITGVPIEVGTNDFVVTGSNAVGTVAGAGVTVIRLPRDADEDGIDDTWERLYFTNLTYASSTSDADSDGFIDLYEFLAGTDPWSTQSLLRATDTLPSATTNGFIVRWQSESNKLYILWRSDDLLQGFVGIASNIPASYPVNSYTDAPVSNAVQTYRIQLQLP